MPLVYLCKMVIIDEPSYLKTKSVDDVIKAKGDEKWWCKWYSLNSLWCEQIFICEFGWKTYKFK